MNAGATQATERERGRATLLGERSSSGCLGGARGRQSCSGRGAALEEAVEREQPKEGEAKRVSEGPDATAQSVKARHCPTRCLPLDGSQAAKPPLALPSTERQANDEIASGGPPGGLGGRRLAAGNSSGGEDMEVGAGIGRAPPLVPLPVPLEAERGNSGTEVSGRRPSPEIAVTARLAAITAGPGRCPTPASAPLTPLPAFPIPSSSSHGCEVATDDRGSPAGVGRARTAGSRPVDVDVSDVSKPSTLPGETFASEEQPLWKEMKAVTKDVGSGGGNVHFSPFAIASYRLPSPVAAAVAVPPSVRRPAIAAAFVAGLVRDDEQICSYLNSMISGVLDSQPMEMYCTRRAVFLLICGGCFGANFSLFLWLTLWTFQSFLVAGFVAVLHLSSTSSSLLRQYKVHIMDERTSTPLPKLASSNYVSWAKTMEHFIRSKGLWGLVDGSKSEPQLVLTKTIDGKAYELDGVEKDKVVNEYEKRWEEWKIGHHKIITWIIACVDTTTIGQIAKHNFAHEAWEFLKKTHTMKDVAYMCNLQMKIASLQQGDKSIKEYVGEMEQLWDELALFEPECSSPLNRLKRRAFEIRLVLSDRLLLVFIRLKRRAFEIRLPSSPSRFHSVED
ncbi:hypothetical protein EJ110_NYTH37030 [Nymphaea thermarum]|nr:hypothetical protein EJ110_NYTH37030 [Nymphaea thermarum]